MLNLPNLAKPSLTDRIQDFKNVSTHFTDIFGGGLGDLSLLELKSGLKLKTVIFFLSSVREWIGGPLIKFH